MASTSQPTTTTPPSAPATAAMAECPYRTSGGLPLRIEPADARPESRDLARLCEWLEAHPAWVQARLHEHGALRFRGFDVGSAADFERLARAIDDELKNDYMGTSPRDALTDYVFSASELPDFYPIPQHCEMSFCAVPPRRVFFCCLVEPADGSGETPLCDFRKVWNDLAPDVRERFERGGLRIVRNYASPDDLDANDPTQLKPWPDIFHTTDRTEVERMCTEEGFEAHWLEGGALRLVSTQPVTRPHPQTGETVWHNHLTTFHLTTAEAELRRIAEYRPTERHQNLAKFAVELEKAHRQKSPEEQGMHTTHLDGSAIPEEDVEHVRDIVWRHLAVESWKLGDVVAIDNHSTSHGRLPYEGDRQVVVCWA